MSDHFPYRITILKPHGYREIGRFADFALAQAVFNALDDRTKQMVNLDRQDDQFDGLTTEEREGLE